MSWEYGTILPKNLPPCPDCNYPRTMRAFPRLDATEARYWWDCPECSVRFHAAWKPDPPKTK